MSKVTQPYKMLAGGYQIIFKNGKVSQVFGSKAKEKRFKEEDRRQHRSQYRGWSPKLRVSKKRPS
jgi:hypothetical protein